MGIQQVKVKKYIYGEYENYFLEFGSIDKTAKLSTINTVSTNITVRAYSHGLQIDFLGGMKYLNDAFHNQTIKLSKISGDLLNVEFVQEENFRREKTDILDIDTLDTLQVRVQKSLKIKQIDSNISGIIIDTRNLMNVKPEDFLNVINYEISIA